MKYKLRLRLISLIILRYYLQPFHAWLTLKEVVYTEYGLPMFLLIDWRYYRQVFPWFIQAVLPRSHRVTSIDTVATFDDATIRYDVQVGYDAYTCLY